MRFAVLLVFVSILRPSSEVSAQTTLTGGFMFGGLARDYRLYIPASYQPGIPVPLVFNLHGYTSDAFQQELYGDFRPIADTANFILVHPNGTIDGLGNRGWNTFGASSVDDLGYLTALLDTISAQYSIDPNRVYSTGMSNGGFMSYELACQRSDRFAAIASVTGTLINSGLTNCNAGHPMPVLQVHGTADPTVPYAGGSGFVGIEALVDYWVQFNGCSTTPVISQVPNTSTTDGCTADHLVYSGGQAGSSVEFFKVIGGQHTWPGSPFVIGVTNQDFSASREIWRFFSQYRLNELQTGIARNNASGDTFLLAPNPAQGPFELRFDAPELRTITVVDATGRVVRNMRSSNTVVPIELDVPGLYFTVVQGAAGSVTRRVVVER